jgi:hypothetical protein
LARHPSVGCNEGNQKHRLIRKAPPTIVIQPANRDEGVSIAARRRSGCSSAGAYLREFAVRAKWPPLSQAKPA